METHLNTLLQTLSAWQLTGLDRLWLAAAMTALLALLLGRWRWFAALGALLYALQFGLLISTQALSGEPVFASFQLQLFHQQLTWRFHAVSWFFGLIVIGAAFVSSWFSAADAELSGGRGQRFHLALALHVVALMVLLASSDALTLLLGWELVGWTGLLLVLTDCGSRLVDALKERMLGVIGSMFLLAAIGLLYAATGSFAFNAIEQLWTVPSTVALWSLLGLLSLGFALATGLVPFHWPRLKLTGYTQSSATLVVSVVTTRMSLFAVLLIVLSAFGDEQLEHMFLPLTWISAHDLGGWFAALTIVVATIGALKQRDIRFLLAWLMLAQSGYLWLGLVFGGAQGSAGSLLLVFADALAQFALWLLLLALVNRSGDHPTPAFNAPDTNRALQMMIAIIAVFSLAGLPPTLGFVAKWLLYGALIESRQWILLALIALANLGLLFVLLRFLHRLFLIEPSAPKSSDPGWQTAIQLAPILGLATLTIVAGIAPGPALSWVAHVQQTLALPIVRWHPEGIMHFWWILDTPWIAATIKGLGGVALLVVWWWLYRATRASVLPAKVRTYAYITPNMPHHEDPDESLAPNWIITPIAWPAGLLEFLGRRLSPALTVLGCVLALLLWAWML